MAGLYRPEDTGAQSAATNLTEQSLVFPMVGQTFSQILLVFDDYHP
jgi:hypothetical protein